MSDTTFGYRPGAADPLDPALEELLRGRWRTGPGARRIP